MGKYAFGVDVGGTTVKLGLFDKGGKALETWEIPTVKDNNGEAILPDVAKSILAKMEEKGIRDRRSGSRERGRNFDLRRRESGMGLF